MIEEKLTIDFGEYVSTYHATGKLRDVAEIAQSCSDAIDKAVNDFLSGVTTIAHHGFNIHGKNFHVSVEVKPSDDDDDDLVSLNISDACGGSAEFCFDATRQLVMTKTYNCVHIG